MIKISKSKLTQEQITQIKDFYNPKSEYNSIVLTTPEGSKFIPMFDYESQIITLAKPRSVYLTFGIKCNSEKEALAAGAIKTNDKEIAEAFAPDLFQSIQGSKIDKRSLSYLKTCKQNLQLVAIKHGWDEIPHDTDKSISVWFNTSQVKIGKVTEGEYTGKYIATYSMRTNIDDYDIVSLIFEKKPCLENIQTATLLESVEIAFTIHRRNPVFNCWECGNESHWLDIPGTFEEKVGFWKEKYCNQC